MVPSEQEQQRKKIDDAYKDTMSKADNMSDELKELFDTPEIFKQRKIKAEKAEKDAEERRRKAKADAAARQERRLRRIRQTPPADDEDEIEPPPKKQRRTNLQRLAAKARLGPEPDAEDAPGALPLFRRILKKKTQEHGLYPAHLDDLERDLFPFVPKSASMWVEKKKIPMHDDRSVDTEKDMSVARKFLLSLKETAKDDLLRVIQEQDKSKVCT